MNKRDITGICMLGLVTLVMVWALVFLDFEKTGLAVGDFVCGDGYCESNEITGCPDDCDILIEEDIDEFEFIEGENSTDCILDWYNCTTTWKAIYEHSLITDEIAAVVRLHERNIIDEEFDLLLDLMMEDPSISESIEFHYENLNEEGDIISQNVFVIIDNSDVNPDLTDYSILWYTNNKIINIEGLSLNKTIVEEYLLEDHFISGSFFQELLTAYSNKYPSDLAFKYCNNNAACEGNENKYSCPLDCNVAIDSCNNNSICEPGENLTNCASDCECTINDTRSYGVDEGECNSGTEICYNGTWAIQIPAIEPVNETCDSYDNDCDGYVDEGFDWNDDGGIDDNETFDYDDDGYFPEITVYYNLTCSGYDDDEEDCDDENSSINPGKDEKINNIDDDCDGYVDENATAESFNTSIQRIDLGILKKNGSKAYLRVLDWATFKLNDIYGKVEVKELTNSKATLVVTVISGSSITPLPEIEISLGETKEFNLDNNVKNEISIKLDNIQNSFKAFLTIKDISELLSPPVCDNNGLCENEETSANCPGDCLVVINCNYNGFCDFDENEEDCPEDCFVDEIKEPIIEQPELVAWECNNNGICEGWESEEDCPKDCKKDYFKYIKDNLKETLIGVGALMLLITLTTSTVVVRNKLNPYHVKKSLKSSLMGFIDKGYTVTNIGYYLTGQKLKQPKIKKALRFTHDFTTLKKAVMAYLAQGHNEKEIRKMCLKNKWSKRIIKDVFKDIKAQQAKIMKKRTTNTRNQRYNVLNKFNIKR